MTIIIDGNQGISGSGVSAPINTSTAPAGSVQTSALALNTITSSQLGAVNTVISSTATLAITAGGNTVVTIDSTGNVFTVGYGFTFLNQNVQVLPTNKTRTVFIPTGADQSFAVPGNVSWIYAKLWGAGGAAGSPGGWVTGSRGGGGGYARGLIPVVPGETLTIMVGLAGQTNYAGTTTPRYGGGGGLATNTNNFYAGSGGGLTGIFRGASNSQANALLIAGGGGGGGSSRFRDGNWGGAGGGATGQTGNAPYDGFVAYGGGAATQTAGGTAGTGAAAGSALTGGAGGPVGVNPYGGGGGGGYWGGGGGGYVESNTMAGGGGGSGFISSGVRQAALFTGQQNMPALNEDQDLAKTIDAYNNWNKYAWGGDANISGSAQYTNTGGGGGYCVIYY